MGNVLRTIGLIFLIYFATRMMRRWLTARSAPGPSPFEVLGLEQDATDEQIEATWRRLIMENHPDRVAKLDPAIQKLAAQRTKAINKAYQQLQRRR